MAAAFRIERHKLLVRPQRTTLNLYSYTENGPINRIDADGHNVVGMDGLRRSTTGGFNEIDNVIASIMAADSAFDLYAQAVNAQPQQAQNPQSGRQPDGSYMAPTGKNSEIAKMDAAADQGKPMSLVGSGECVALTSHLTGVTEHTASWRQGPKVVNADGTINDAVKPGTAIATFDSSGHYRHGPGAKNSGVFLGPGIYSGKGSIRIIDQWNAHPPNPANPPQSRDVRFYNNAIADVSNNANAYYVIIVPR